MLNLITPASYWVLTILWLVILFLYLYKLRHSKVAGGAVSVLLTLLAIDAFRTLFESVYFGLYFNSMFGLLPNWIYEYLSQPAAIIVPKLINIIAGFIVLVLLIRRWVPREIHEREEWIQNLQESESNLRESEEQFRRGIMSAPFPIMIHAEDGEVIRINDAWTGLSGYTHNEIPTISDWVAKAYGQKVDDVRVVLDALYKANNVVNEGEFTVTTKSGEDQIWDFSSAPLGKMKDGRRLAISTAIDITERKAAEEALHASRNLIHTILENVPILVFWKDPSLNYLGCNTAFARSAGFSRPKDLQGKDDSQTCWREQAEFYRADDKWVIDSKTPKIGIEKQQTTPGGQTIWVRTSKVPLFDAEKNVIGLLGIDEDITERKQAEEALLKSEKLLNDILHSTADWVWEVDEKNVYTYTSPNGIAMFGNLIGKTPFDFMPQDEAKRIEQIFSEITANRAPIKDLENWNVTKNGDSICLLTNGVPILDMEGRLIGYRGVDKDITDRKLAEQALRDSETKHRAMVENILDVITIIDKDGTIRFTSPNLEKWFGWRPEERIGGSPWEDIHPDDRDRIRKIFADLIENPGLTATAECRYRRKDGGYEWIGLSGINRLQDPNIAGILISHHIITERKRSEEILRESEERFRLLVENAPDAIFARNKRGCFTYLNKASIALFGATSAQELIGTPIIERYHPKVRETLLRRMQIINEQQLAAPLLQSICLQLNGNEVNVETTAVPMHYMGEDGALVFMRDITDRIEQQKRQHSLEKQLHQSQKLESVGTLAGGIAHDFNNVLTGLYGNIALAKMKLANDHPGFRFLEEAEQSMLRTTLLTNRLLTFAKGGDPVTKSLSLVIPIEEVVNLSLSGSNVKPVVTSAANLWQVRGDQRQIEQVFASLTINAREAMPDGGHLYITMENAELADKAEHGLPGGKYLRITVTDEGTGIEHKLLDKIFDPYFTTKEMGSGLGLASAYSIIDKHGGHISVTSRLGKGTTFTIYLPATEVVEEAPLTQPVVTQVPLNQRAKILVMDDEEMIRNMLNEMLGELDFAVETAVEGQQAIDMYRQAMETRKPFSIVILDLTIPGGMGGHEAAKGILQIDPEAKIIVSSGYADDPLTANYADYGFKGAATKPYSMNKLSGVLSQVMEKG